MLASSSTAVTLAATCRLAGRAAAPPSAAPLVPSMAVSSLGHAPGPLPTRVVGDAPLAAAASSHVAPRHRARRRREHARRRPLVRWRLRLPRRRLRPSRRRLGRRSPLEVLFRLRRRVLRRFLERIFAPPRPALHRRDRRQVPALLAAFDTRRAGSFGAGLSFCSVCRGSARGRGCRPSDGRRAHRQVTCAFWRRLVAGRAGDPHRLQRVRSQRLELLVVVALLGCAAADRRHVEAVEARAALVVLRAEGKARRDRVAVRLASEGVGSEGSTSSRRRARGQRVQQGTQRLVVRLVDLALLAARRGLREAVFFANHESQSSSLSTSGTRTACRSARSPLRNGRSGRSPG